MLTEQQPLRAAPLERAEQAGRSPDCSVSISYSVLGKEVLPRHGPHRHKFHKNEKQKEKRSEAPAPHSLCAWRLAAAFLSRATPAPPSAATAPGSFSRSGLSFGTALMAAPAAAAACSAAVSPPRSTRLLGHPSVSAAIVTSSADTFSPSLLRCHVHVACVAFRITRRPWLRVG